jgi:hypothetical protein
MILPDEEGGEELDDAVETSQSNQLPDERASETPLRDWREHIANPKLRASTGKFTSLEALVESYNHTAGRLKSAIFVPGEDAGEEDIAKYRQALGVPDSVEGYTIDTPDGEEYDEGDQAIIEEFAEVALEHNIPAAAFNAFMMKLAERATGLRENVVEQIEDAREEAEDMLLEEWGNSLEKNVQLAARAARGHGGDRFVKFLESVKVEGAGLLGDHPEMVRFLAQIGSKSDEHDMLMHSTATERQTAQQRIEEIYEKYPPGSPGYGSKRVQEELKELFEKVHGDRPIAGAPTRG